MSAPNLLTSSSVVGASTFVSGISTTVGTVILSNASNSNQVLKLNTLVAANNINTSVNFFLKIFNQAAGAGSSVSIASSISIPSGASLTVIGKDIPIYLEENRSLWVLAGSISSTTSATNAIDVVASYEIIS